MKRIVFSIALFFAAMLSKPAVADVRHSIGVAHDTDDNSVRYIEHHQYLQNGKHVVRYYDTQSNVLLEKELEYPGLPQHPVIRQSDYLTDTMVEVEQNRDEATIIKEANGDRDVFTFPLAEHTIIDAGFDAYIRNYWSAFKQSPRQAVRFAVAGQKRLLDMAIEQRGAEDGLTKFVVEPANWFVRMLVPAITLYYDDNRRLARYEGFSNLKPGEGASREVVIRFEHFESDETLPDPLPQWLSEGLPTVSAR